jgi:hypothetical protein
MFAKSLLTTAIAQKLSLVQLIKLDKILQIAVRSLIVFAALLACFYFGIGVYQHVKYGAITEADHAAFQAWSESKESQK